MHTDQCLILAGGYGSRLRKITKKIPKPLIKINKKPFIFYLIKFTTNLNLSLGCAHEEGPFYKIFPSKY